MKKLLSLLIPVLFISFHLFAQQQTKMTLALMKRLQSASKQQNEISLFVKGDIAEITKKVTSLGGTVKYSSDSIAAIRISIHQVHALASSEAVINMEDPYPLEILNDRMVINNNVIPVHIGVTPLLQGYDGTGVVVGIIDSGCDFNHPDFKDTKGKSRIKYLWDHTLSNGPNTPSPYGYGQEFTANDIDSGRAGAHYDKLYGHGTHVTGIAAGNGNAVNNYKGVAPGADIIVAALNFNSGGWLSSVVDACDYIYKKAKAMGKPCVINISAGTYYGSHDGKDLQAQLINNMVSAENGRALACATGNAGNVKFHLGYDVTTDTSFTWFKYTSNGIYCQIWSDTSEFENVKMAFGADKSTPFYEYRGRTTFRDIAFHLNKYTIDTLYSLSGNPIAIVESYGTLFGERYSMEFAVRSDSTDYLWRLMTTGTGRIDLWNYDMKFDALPSTDSFPDIAKYKSPDILQTMVSSFTCAPNVITVGSYVNRDYYTDFDGVIENNPKPDEQAGMLTPNSSKGPTRDGRIKPEVTATGLWLLSCGVTADMPWFIANQSWKLAPGGKHILSSGTSMASPVVAGIAALYLQKNPNATYLEVKDAITKCAKQDAFTGTALPNNYWGYGKVDAFKTLTGCATGIEDPFSKKYFTMISYPNPFSDHTTIYYDLSGLPSFKEAELQISDAAGRIVKKIILLEKTNTLSLHRNGLSAGMYFYALVSDGKLLAAQKLIVTD